ncbi:T9SS type A sorting domain-containing protein [uncultured Pontibacter sp.]|uniref:T9SS type A sorting domain-containing protein n=1 Tax=uncultured Pontibacter sp. TaxID=453356 RepID=UPI002607A3DC|nr:T9SS type A sorting domain-containing protein [uncultured Pontibacter sp.]
MTTLLLTPDRFRSRRAAFVMAFFLSVLSFHAFASEGLHMVPLSLEERIKAADFIVEGEVVAQRSFWDTKQENIYTVNTIRLYKVFKGEIREKQLEIVTEGGSVGLAMHQVSSALRLQKGQQGLFLLSKGARIGIVSSPSTLLTSPYASRQGFVKYDVERASAADPFNDYSSIQEVYGAVTSRTGRNYSTVIENERLDSSLRIKQQKDATQATQAPVITSFTPTRTSAGTGAVLTIRGTGFGNSQGNGFVEFPDADRGGTTTVKPFPTDYLSWSNTEIRVRVPSFTQAGGTAGTGRIRVTADGVSTQSAGTLVIEFAYSNVVAEGGNTPVQPVLIDMNRSGGYTLQFAPSMQSRAAAQEGFRRAVNKWVCTTNVNWEIGAPTTIENAVDDNRSVIRFASSSVTGDNVLARTISRYRGCAIEYADGRRDTIFWLTEFDMEINNGITWQFGPGAPTGNQFDFETVILHELGHAHQLGHVILPNALMNYEIEQTAQVRDLTPPDIAGANLILNRSLNPPACGGRSPMTPKLDGECNLAEEIFTFDASFTSGNAVDVIWTTSREQGISRFVIQRSQNGVEWEEVGEVNASGRANDYSFTDNDPLPRRSYYRLRVIYSDGSDAFSGRASVINPDDLRTFKVYPNPVGLTTSSSGTQQEIIQVEYLVRTTSNLSLKLYDMQGRLVRDLEAIVTDGTNSVEIDVSDIASGTYFLRWSEGNSSGVAKVIKL